MVGKLEVIYGPMGAGKTTALLGRLYVTTLVKNTSVIYVNSSMDTRSSCDFSTHNPFLVLDTTKFTKVVKVRELGDILSDLEAHDVIGIDEAQFFDDLYETAVYLVEKLGKHVVVAGLDLDYRRRPFGHTLRVAGVADSITRLSGICKVCAETSKTTPSIFTKKHPETNRVDNTNANDYESNIQSGGMELYSSVCRKCYLKN